MKTRRMVKLSEMWWNVALVAVMTALNFTYGRLSFYDATGLTFGALLSAVSATIFSERVKQEGKTP